MDYQSFNDLIRDALRARDREPAAQDHGSIEARTSAVANAVIDEAAAAAYTALPGDADGLAALWAVRAAVAADAHVLNRAMDPLWEREGPGTAAPDLDPAAVPARVRELATGRLADAAGGAASPVLTAMVSRVTDGEAARAAPGSGVVEVGRAVRVALSKVGLRLQRASACLWTAALVEERAVRRAPTAAARTSRRIPTARDAATALAATQELARVVESLDVDPAALPVGPTAVAEARAVCVALGFLQRRFDELRRWVHPGAAVDATWSSYPEVGADAGERMILRCWQDGDMDAADLRTWTWCGRDDGDYVLGDVLSDLRHAADALGLDWEASVGTGEGHHDEEVREAAAAEKEA